MHEYLNLIVGLGAPIFATIGGILAWFLKSRKEELRAIEERAIERRIETYNKILHPMVVLFSNGASEEQQQQASDDIVSIEYRQAAFNLITFGSDEMVKSYNSMMQSMYQQEFESAPKENLRKVAAFILSIRKDVYTKRTKLGEWEMLEFMITDIHKLKDQ